MVQSEQHVINRLMAGWGQGPQVQTNIEETDRERLPCCEWKLMTVDPQERSTRRSVVRSAMHAASQLPGRGPTDVNDAPAPACLSKI